MDQVDQKETNNLTPADRQLLAREVAADRYGGSIYTKGDFKAGWDAALGWVGEQAAEVQSDRSTDKGLVAAFQERIRRLETEIEELRPVVESAIEWRRDGYERRADFYVGIKPLLDAIDVYDVGAPRPCEEL